MADRKKNPLANFKPGSSVTPSSVDIGHTAFGEPTINGVTQQQIEDQTNLLNPSEARFNEQGIAEQNAWEADAVNRNLDTVKQNAPYARGGAWAAEQNRQANFLDEGGPAAAITRARAIESLPITKRRDWNSQQDFVITNYPRLYKAAQDANLSADEIYRMVNITLAVDAALTIGKTRSQQRVTQLLKSMPQEQAALVWDVINAMSIDMVYQDAANKKAAAEPGNPLVQKATEWFWNPSIKIPGLSEDTDWGPVRGGELYYGAKGTLDTLISANEMSVRVVNTLQLRSGTENWDQAWNATEAGSFDPKMVDLVKANNDPIMVEVMLDVKIARARGEDLASLYKKYDGDTARINALDAIGANLDPNSEISKISNLLDTAETSNPANVLLWSLGTLNGSNPGQDASDTEMYSAMQTRANSDFAKSFTPIMNAVITFAADPTLAAGRVNKAANIARYGIKGLDDASKVEKVFQYGRVQRHFNTIGAELQKVRELKTAAERAQRLQSLASQYKNWYKYDSLVMMLDGGVKDAETAKQFINDGIGFEHIMSGQGAKRGYEKMVPHMTWAGSLWKANALKVRGLNPTNMGANKFLDAVFGEGTSSLMPTELAERISKKIEEDPVNIGRLMGDFAYTDTGGVRRTILGRIIKPTDDVNSFRNRMNWNRYGWRRKGIFTGDPMLTLDRLGRNMAHMPDIRGGIDVTTANDAEAVRNIAQGVGMPRHFANTLKYVWSNLDEPSRIRLMNGLNRSGMYASGVDLVSPELADEFEALYAMASRRGTQYAADQVDILLVRANAERIVAEQRRAAKNAMTETEVEDAVRAESRRLIDDQLSGNIADDFNPIDDTPEILTKSGYNNALYQEIRRGINEQIDNGNVKNPSALNETDNYALYDYQLTTRVSAFDVGQMSQLMARQSYLNMLLGGGARMTKLTDLWTLATLAGPRFVMRSGLEDFMLYALTGGKFFGHGGWMDSRRASSAIRESTMRAPGKQLGHNPGMKLGIFATARREFGTMLAERMPAVRGLILPYLTKEELENAMLAAKAGDREALANLVWTAFARQRFFSWNRVRYAKGEQLDLSGKDAEIAQIIADGMKYGKMPAAANRASEVTEHLADGSATALDNVAPGTTEVVEGVTIRHELVGLVGQSDTPATGTRTVGWGTKWNRGKGSLNPDDIESMYLGLYGSLYMSGTKGYFAVAASQKYYRLRMAVHKADTVKKILKAEEDLRVFIDDFAETVANDPRIGQYVLAKELGVREFSIRILDDALRMMTTADGRYNVALLRKLRLPNYKDVVISEDLAERIGLTYRPNRTGMVRVTVNQKQWDDAYAIADDVDRAALDASGRPVKISRKSGDAEERRYGTHYYDNDGKFRYNLTVQDLYDPALPQPQSVRTADKIQVAVSDKIPFTTAAWSKMGRALARLTREPIYMSNYVDIFQSISGFRQKMVKDLVAAGKSEDDAIEMANKWAHDYTANQAYDLTMAYVDNPAIRSQMAWNVRNIARFYRALEDFNRRMMRVATNKPETFWKAALVWNVLDDSGFVWEDEYGDKYFLFPGTQVAFSAINNLASFFGLQPRIPSMPTTWGGKVTMLSPSLDPNALAPTLGSPWSAFAFKGLLRLMPGLAEAAGMGDMFNTQREKTVESALFGPYSAEQTLAGSIANDYVGSNVSRMIDAVYSLKGGATDRQAATESAVAVAGKQAIHAMVAGGVFDPSKNYTNEEIAQLQSWADTAAVNALILKAVLTPFLPATPQTVMLDVSDEMRELGIDSGDALWLSYLNSHNSYDEAFIAFTKDHPGRAIFTVSKYTNRNNAYYASILETADFVENNRDEFEAHPMGLSHFAPMEGTYGGLSSFYFLKANDVKVPNSVQEYFEKSIQSAGQAEMRYIDRQAAADLAAGEDPKIVEDTVSRAKDIVRATYPLVEYNRSMSLDQGADQRAVDEIVASAHYMVNTGRDSDGRAAKYLEVYSQFLLAKADKDQAGDDADQKTIANKAWTKYVVESALPTYRADRRWVQFLRALTGALDVSSIRELS